MSNEPSAILSERAGKIASFIIRRGNRRRLAGIRGETPWEKRYTHICALARRKYDAGNVTPEWIGEGKLD